ncbi:FecCD family ABC transporter permease [Bacillus sp. Hm123]|uniref:FecCD family ABC transporter permease n=1 Tax=Bacillus sp. Hm123 TaxID=3450745 RepID=UPI003F43E988
MSENTYAPSKKKLISITNGRLSLAIVCLVASVALIVFLMACSISFGAADIQLSTVWGLLLSGFDQSLESSVIYDFRLPRAIGAVAIGMFLAVSGAIMQAMTRNPLASPSLMGVSDGAIFAIAISYAFFPGISFSWKVVFSFIGAALGASVLYGIGSLSKGGLTPVKLALAGAAVSGFLGAISSGIALYFELHQEVAMWSAGGVASVQWGSLKLLIPLGLLALVIAIMLSRYFTILNFGEEMATGLGQNVLLIKALGTILVVIMTGAAVSMAGSVGFVGLVIPHIARMIVGTDYRLIIPVSAVLGGVLLSAADLLARTINPPYETPLGAITALIGVPFFLYLARKEGGKSW